MRQAADVGRSNLGPISLALAYIPLIKMQLAHASKEMCIQMDFSIRHASLPEDAPAILAVPRVAEADYELEVCSDESGFRLVPRSLPARRSWIFPVTADDLMECDVILIAESHGLAAGWCACKLHKWNMRWEVIHLYVGPEYRGCGLGTGLLRAAEELATSAGAREIWVEAQNTNPKACCFYSRFGFRLTGLDTTLYAAETQAFPQTALFYSLWCRRE
jgi:ribosomal protein S18 acetylase RimI-like enzyme